MGKAYFWLSQLMKHHTIGSRKNYDHDKQIVLVHYDADEQNMNKQHIQLS